LKPSSATGRLTEAILPHLYGYLPYIAKGRILEPAAGDGAIVRVLERFFPEAQIDAGDISTEQDFLKHDYPGPYHLIITNPPYCRAIEFVQRALSLRHPNGLVAMLLRLNFLGSQERARWLRENPPSVYVSPR